MWCNFYYIKTKCSVLTRALASIFMILMVGLSVTSAQAQEQAQESLVAELSIESPIAAQPSLNKWSHNFPQAQAIGSGELRWFGFRIYSATLWTNAKRFDVNQPFALELTYHRSIKRTQFVDTSLNEIKRLFGKRYSKAVLSRWEAHMNTAFNDVHAGDKLIGVFVPNKGCEFYSQHQLLARIDDPEFAQAFFAIWFDERTKDQALRAQLLGSNPRVGSNL